MKTCKELVKQHLGRELMFKILIFYKSISAVKNYLEMFRNMPLMVFEETRNSFTFNGEKVNIKGVRCAKISDQYRGYRAHIIAVQEELTWAEDWNEVRDRIVYPMLQTPIDIQIFDGDYPDEQAA